MSEIISIKSSANNLDQFDPITFLNENSSTIGLDYIDPTDIYHDVMDQSNVLIYIHHIKSMEVPQKILVVKSISPSVTAVDYSAPMRYAMMVGNLAENIITGHEFPFEKIIFYGTLSEKWMFCADVGINLNKDETIQYCRTRKEPLQ